MATGIILFLIWSMVIFLVVSSIRKTWCLCTEFKRMTNNKGYFHDN